ncbi:MAG: ThiF family adenylyltransferase [Deltaproteobacteria bacterium]|nr:MAG: ThiF family adenylyltransferase [Deltaproteobacteria bacterium]
MNKATRAIEGPLEPTLAQNTSIKLIGLGGVGGIVARYLSLFLASLNRTSRLVLIDGDSFEPSNASRMFFVEHSNKATAIRKELLPQLSESFLSLVAIPEYVTATNIARFIHDGDVVILAVDNHATRKLVSDFCRTLEEVCLISGGNDGVGLDTSNRMTRGTYGNCQIYIRLGGQDLSPFLTRYHSEIREPADRHPAENSCTEMVQYVPQILFTNLTAASAILNTFWLFSCGALHYSELVFDTADGLMRPMPLPPPDLGRVTRKNDVAE